MKTKSFFLSACLLMASVTVLAQPMGTERDGLIFGRYARLATVNTTNLFWNALNNHRAMGVYQNDFNPQSMLEVNTTNAYTPFFLTTIASRGEVFRTVGPATDVNAWRLLTGPNLGTEKAALFTDPALGGGIDFTIQASQPNSVMRLNTGGANQRIWISQNNVNEPRVGIGTTLAFPQTYLQLGEDVLGNSGWRNWMNVGTLCNWDSDNMYVGLRRVAGDRNNAIINCGNYPPTQTPACCRVGVFILLHHHPNLPAKLLVQLQVA